MLLGCKGDCVDKKEKNRGKIEQERNYYPESLGVIDIKYSRVLDLFIQEEDAEKDEKAGFQACRQRVETGRSFAEDIDQGNYIKE